MKATMSPTGVITLQAENSIESYALACWADSAWITQRDMVRAETGHWRSSSLIIDPNPPKKET